MKRIDIFFIAFGNFRRRKVRSILTVLGVVIGTASIVVMISLGIAVNQTFEQQLESMGDLTTITVSAKYGTTGQIDNPLTDDAVKFLEAIKNVKAVSPEILLNGKMIAGKYSSYSNVVGVRPAYMKNLGFEAAQGSLLNENAVIEKTIKNVNCIFGSDVALSFYDPKKQGGGNFVGKIAMAGGSEQVEKPQPLFDPMDSKTRLRFTFDYSYGEPNTGDNSQPVVKTVFYSFKNVGLLKQSFGDKDYSIYIDLETARKLKKEQLKQQASQGGSQSQAQTKVYYDQIKVITNSINETIEITKQIKDMGYEAWSNAEWIQSSKDQAKMLQLLLGGIGSVSLLVAAIGITNTMIMSIYERTRDIGVMKVIGCILKDIRDMFLCEAAIIGLVGGIVGIGLSYAVSILLNIVGKGFASNMGAANASLSVIPVWLALAAIVFSSLIGIAAGFFPARRAMKLSALEAMRN